MAEKSTGQWVGAIVGAVVAYFTWGVGYVAMGAAVGGAVGGAIDPPKGPHLIGPRLSDLSQQTSSYGVAIPRIYGTVAMAGNVFWIENNRLKEVEKNDGGGKGGGGSPTTTTYSYYATFAVGLCRGPIDGVRRIWAGSKLIYDAGSDDIESIVASNQAAEQFVVYRGTEDQLPDDRMQATLGVDNVPAYRGLAYIVFRDFPLADYGNSLLGCPIKVEVIEGQMSNHNLDLGELIDPGYFISQIGSIRFNEDRFLTTTLNLNPDYSLNSVHAQETVIGGVGARTLSETPVLPYEEGFFTAKLMANVIQSDLDCVVIGLYTVNQTKVISFDSGGSLICESGFVDDDILPYGLSWSVVDRGQCFMLSSGSKLYKFTMGIYPDDALFVMATSATLNCEQFGVSENYIFCVELSASNTSCTVFKFDRSTMELLVTYTQPVSARRAKIYVVDDNEFYTMGVINSTFSPLVRWKNGVAILTGIAYLSEWSTHSFERLIVDSENLAYVCHGPNPDEPHLHAIWQSIASNSVPLADILEEECLSSGLIESADINVSAITSEVFGYRVSSVAAIRSAIEPLQAAWPFDVIQAGYQIKFIPRGQAAIASVEIDNLVGSGASSGNRKAVRMTHSREMDTQLPQRVSVTYLDLLREYDVGAGPGAERLNTPSVNVRQVELAIVLDADAAAGIEETLLYLYWLERHDISFTLPPPFRHLEPADVITIESPQAVYHLRLVSITYLASGSLECQAKFNAAAIYSPTAVGESVTGGGSTIGLRGRSNFVPLDLPTLIDGTNAIGFVAAVNGSSPNWPGGVLMRSDDAGQQWATLQGFNPPGAVAGLVFNVLPATRTDIKDGSTIIHLSLGVGDLYSVSEAQLLAGANHFAVGRDGRWEIVGAQTCVQQPDGSWLLSDLLRGRFGTEWAAGAHAAFDVAVLLDPTRLKFIDSNQNAIGMPSLYRAVTRGKMLDSADSVPFVYRGVNLKPLSPVFLNGYVDISNDNWVLSWQRRTRLGGEWRDLVDAALSETTEAYEVEIWDSGYSTLVRTISGITSPAVTYSADDQIADFGSYQTTLHLKIFQMSSVVGRGFPLIESISRSNNYSDPYWSSVSTLLHFEGADGSTTFTCEKGIAYTASGNAQISTAEAKFGSSSGLFDGASDFVFAANNPVFLFGAGDLTVEAFVNPTATVVATGMICGLWDSGSLSWALTLNPGNGVGFAYSTTGIYQPANDISSTANVIVVGAWNHVAWVRIGATMTLYVNGFPIATKNCGTDTLFASSGQFKLGGNTNNQWLNAHPDELRITKGVGRYTAAFQPPRRAFSNS